MIFLALAAGAVLLIWPAFLNGYPLVFSDTGGLLSTALEPTIGWDKPWVYGPFLLALHGRFTLWLPCLAQGLAVSHVLWMVQKVTIGALPWRHLALCAVLAAGTAAPWFAALLMPDIFAPLTVLCLFLLAFGEGLSKVERGWLVALGAFSIGVHLAHLIVAAACLVPVLALRWRRLAVCAAPLALALAALLLTNIAGNGVAAISPYGSVFALARLQADGIASDYLRDACPGAGYRLCAWTDRMPMDSDKFLWDPDGPVWGNQFGPTLMAPEASRVVAATLRAYPIEALRTAVGNALQELTMVRVGDALGSDYLDVTVLPRLQTYFPPQEAARFNAGLQARGLLAADASAFRWLHVTVLLAGVGGSVLALALWKGRPGVAALAVFILVGLAANAFATGALSGPHDRYQARIAWLVLLPGLLTLPAFARRRLGSSGPAPRSRSAAFP